MIISPPRWYVMRAYKKENRAAVELFEAGFEVYYPKRKVVRKFGVAHKVVEVPLITSYIFVFASRELLQNFKKVHEYLYYVMVDEDGLRVPLTVRENDMTVFKRIVDKMNDVTIYEGTSHDISLLSNGTPIKIVGGENDGVKGRLLTRRGSKKKFISYSLNGVISVKASLGDQYFVVIPEVELTGGC